MSRALQAEWTKQRTVAGTGWLLLGTITLTVALSATVAVAVSYASGGSSQDLTKLSLTGVYISQAIVAILAVQTMTGEYSTGMIQLTLTATPQRQTVFAANRPSRSGSCSACSTCSRSSPTSSPTRTSSAPSSGSDR